jgi:hypothetical protein
MDSCERCGAELKPAQSHFFHCENCGLENESAGSCLMCGDLIESEDEWWEDGLCVCCAEHVGRP